MIPCVRDHFDVDPCPECGSHHKPFTSLPSTMLTHSHFQALADVDGIDGIKPIFRLHLEEEDNPDNYFKASPLIILISGDTISILWFEIERETWTSVEQVEKAENTFEYADQIGDVYRELATEIYDSMGQPIIDNDPRP